MIDTSLLLDPVLPRPEMSRDWQAWAKSLTKNLASQNGLYGLVDATRQVVQKLEDDYISGDAFVTAAFESAISVVTSDMSAVVTRVTTLETQVQTPTTGLLARVTVTETAITTLNTSVASINTTVTAHTTSINTNTANIATNTANISTNTTSITSLNSSVATLNTTVSSHTTSISTINGSITSLSASVATNATAITTVDGKLSASYAVTVDGNGRIAELKLLSNGTTSDIIFTGDSFKFFDGVSDVALLSAAAGVVTVNGDLAVGGSITVGGVRLAVALEPFEIFAEDGETIEWFNGNSLGVAPKYVLEIIQLSVLASGESYDVRLTGVDDVGAVVYARINTPGATAGQSQTTDTTGGGGEPTRVMHKPTSADAYNSLYYVTISGTVTVTSTFQSGEGGPDYYTNSGEATFTPKFNDGGGWDSAPDIVVTANDLVGYITASDVSGAQGFTLTFPITWEQAVGLHGSYEFGVAYISGGSLTNIDELAYTTQSVSGDRTASPNGEKVKIIVFPRNTA